MAEAVAAFGLAANILQFLDSGAKLITNIWDIYRDHKDGASQTIEIEVVTKHLQATVHDLCEDRTRSDGFESGFYELADKCGSVASELLSILNSIHGSIKAGGKASAVKAILKTKLREDDISSLQKRLKSFRSELMLQLISSLRTQVRRSEEQQESILNGINDVLKSTHSLPDQFEKRLLISEELGSRIVDMIVSKITPSNRTFEKELIEKSAIENLLKTNIDGSDDKPNITSQRFQQLTRRILVRLRYNAITDRVENIVNAHHETFKWVFDGKSKQLDNSTNLSEWLASDSQLYWVTGKAGSGKSTMMKYIAHPPGRASAYTGPSRPRCQASLLQWASPPLKLIIATHFFWNSGTSLEMTQTGLLRSLLHQILSQEPLIIPAACPARWEALCLFGADNSPEWTLTELMEMLRLSITNLEVNIRLCLFIDGLDEFDGDHTILIDLLKDLICKSPNVKVCVASRPWDVFERAFEQRPSIRMEDLTYEDVKAYVSAELTASPEFHTLQQREPSYSDELIRNIVSKASGVFLWVRLVVSSLLSGLSSGDRVVDLQRRLDLLPPELERLYDKMLDSIDQFYFAHAAQLFTLVQVSNEPLTLALMSFIDDETCDSVIEKASSFLTERVLIIRYHSMRRRLNSRTKGLIEVTRSRSKSSSADDVGIGNQTVQYLHRTVRDYMESSPVKQRFHKVLAHEQPYDAYLGICVGLVGYIKFVDWETWCSDEWAPLHHIIVQFMTSARHIGHQSKSDMIRLVDEFSSTILPIASASIPTMRNDFASAIAGPDGRSQLYRIAVHFGLRDYIISKRPDRYIVQVATSDTDLTHIDQSLLIDALGIASIGDYNPLAIRKLQPDVETVHRMLQDGGCVISACAASPNLFLWEGGKPMKLEYFFFESDPLFQVCRLWDFVQLDEANEQAWMQVFQLLIEFHDRYWPIEILLAWSHTERIDYHSSLITLYEYQTSHYRAKRIGYDIEKKPVIPKFARFSASKHARRIQEDRSECLKLVRGFYMLRSSDKKRASRNGTSKKPRTRF